MACNLPLTVEVLHRLSGHRLAERLGFAVRFWVLINKGHLYLWQPAEDDLARIPNGSRIKVGSCGSATAILNSIKFN